MATDSPAAYAIKETQGHKITIKAKFTIFPKSAKAEIKADGGGVLGSIDPQIVTFTNGVSVPEFVSFELHHHTIGNDGIKLEDITWDWKFRCCGGAEWEPLQTTHHRIYVVLEEPRLPWKQSVFPTLKIPGLRRWTTLASGPPVNRIEMTRLRPSPRQSMPIWGSFTTTQLELRITQVAGWRCSS